MREKLDDKTKYFFLNVVQGLGIYIFFSFVIGLGLSPSNIAQGFGIVGFLCAMILIFKIAEDFTKSAYPEKNQKHRT